MGGGSTSQGASQGSSQSASSGSGQNGGSTAGGGQSSKSTSRSAPRRVWNIGGQNGTSDRGSSSPVRRGKVAQRGQRPTGEAAQEVAAVLTEAQYELSQELEANLKKLRSVIQQSQEIAKKIELVLGKGSQGSQSQQ